MNTIENCKCSHPLEWHNVDGVVGCQWTDETVDECPCMSRYPISNVSVVCPECETTTCARSQSYPYCYGTDHV